MSLGSSYSTTANDEVIQQRRRRFSRSPQPYYRQSFDEPERLQLNRQSRPQPLQLVEGRFPQATARSAYSRPTAGRPRRRDNTTSPSDSGTEADDERPLLKALTAPPLRPRKGLKSAKGFAADPLASPLLTPSAIEEDKGQLLLGHAVQERRREKPILEEAARKVNARRKRYGRVEFLRRSFEIVLLGAIGYICLSDKASHVFQAFSWQILLVLAIYSTYVLRVLIRVLAIENQKPFWDRFKLPTTIDPAPLLYPVFLPLLVTWSIRPTDPQVLLFNLILSFSAIPRRVIPQEDFYIHWMLSLLPVISQSLARNYPLPKDLLSDARLYASDGFEEEVLLFPLHCALLQTLGFLTTTSLLPAELQLLSVSLINLLCFGTTSQSFILKGLLWIGGVALVASCRHIMQWSVELARVPGWRFRRRKHRKPSRSILLCALKDTFGGWLSFIINSGRYDESSDEELTAVLARKGRLGHGPNLVDPNRSSASEAARMSNSKQASLDDLAYRGKESHSLTTEGALPVVENSRRRRHTLPSGVAPIPDIPALTKTATDALSSARLRSKLLIRLTPAQAVVLKWLYAAFVYFMVIAIILGPVRIFIGYSALNGNEPVGWALGYLFGDIDAFRFRVVYLNLEHWICLPQRHIQLQQFPGFVEQQRLFVFGQANTRLLICAWCLANIAVGLAVVFRLSSIVEVDTRRKVFHGMMVSMFLPTIFIDPAFVALAFVLILAIFLLLDLFRASQLPPLSRPLTYFLAPYVDGRDHRGPIIISHIFLLIGCAIPLWLSLADTRRTGAGTFEGWDVESRDISMVTGVICVGMGDAAASLIGRRYGHRRWPWSGGKSLEGSAAFAVAVISGLLASRVWLIVGGWNGDRGDGWFTTVTKSTIAACGASMTEAVLTGGNDNVVVPVILWLLVRGLNV